MGVEGGTLALPDLPQGAAAEKDVWRTGAICVDSRCVGGLGCLMCPGGGATEQQFEGPRCVGGLGCLMRPGVGTIDIVGGERALKDKGSMQSFGRCKLCLALSSLHAGFTSAGWGRMGSFECLEMSEIWALETEGGDDARRMRLGLQGLGLVGRWSPDGHGFVADSKT